MCEKWRKTYFNHLNCEGETLDNGMGDFIVKGNIKNKGNNLIMYWASSPPNYRQSYTGSSLPYANPKMAYQNTPNRGIVTAKNGNFKFKIKYPNSYYTGLGSVYMNPHVFIKICKKNGNGEIKSIKLGNGSPYRMLSYPPPPGKAPRSGPMFYIGREKLPIRNQEQICRDSGYPPNNKMPDNFWGLSVPHS
jgi:hypothetical protein